MRIGVDLGGTKIEAAALGAGGTLLARRRTATPQGDYVATVRAVAALVHGLEQETGLAGSVGIGTPGALSPATGRIKNSNSTCLIAQPLREDLSQVLGRPVRLANDADCFALSEAVDGAGEGCSTLFGVIVGTGTGGGIVIHGRLLQGPNAIAGEWGHNPLPWPQPDELPGPPCYCGQRGCLETWISGPGLAGDFFRVTGEPIPAEAIVCRAEQGDAAAESALQRYETRLARGLASVINLLDPEIIVLGGGLSNIPRLYDNVPRLWGRWIFSDTVATRLAPHRHGDSSGVRGAAWLWSEEEAEAMAKEMTREGDSCA
ncbi:MAG: ROK family protein [Magnetococcales bacterium]|nr:ROK family protein [Magnetococcales bacterium]